jgi:hypothetical protein
VTAAEDNPLDITTGGLRSTIRVAILENAHQFAPVVQGIVVGGITRFGKAGTGAAINGLHGVAKSRAILAAAGGGPLADGGGGMAVGEARLGRLAYVPKMIAGGIVLADIVVQAHQEAKAEARRAEEDGTTQA